MQRIPSYNAKPTEMQPKWHLMDASGQVLGRLATQISQILQGKHKAIYTPHVLTGDFVVVVNAANVRTTGHKADQKLYYRHSGYPGALRVTVMKEMLERHPERVIQRAVKGMLPRTKLGRQMLKRLKVYGGEEHPHQAQIRGTGKLPKEVPSESAERPPIPEAKAAKAKSPQRRAPVAKTRKRKASEVKVPLSSTDEKAVPALEPEEEAAPAPASQTEETPTADDEE